jgi:putative peptide zinc metalloprotease protein
VFVRTDVYFVLLDLLRCRDLHNDALRYLRWLLGRLLGRLLPRPFRRVRPESPLAALPDHEARKVRVYAPVVAAGSAVALFTFAAFTIPIAVGTIAGGVRTAWAGAAGGRPTVLVDGLVAAGYQIAFYGTFIAVRLRRRPRKPRPT